MRNDIGRNYSYCMRQFAMPVTRMLNHRLRVVDDVRYVADVFDVRDIDIAYVFRATAIGRHIDLSLIHISEPTRPY